MLLSSGAAAAAGTLRIGVEAAYPPFESLTPAGALQGFDIDVGNALCARMGVRCVWVQNAFDGLIPALDARKFDVIDSAMNITDKRKTAIAFTSPVYVVPMQMVARRTAHLLPTASALVGKRVGVLQGSSQEDYAKHHWAPAGAEVQSYPTQDQIFADLAAGRLDASVQEATVAAESFLSKPEGRDFDFAGPALRDDALLGAGIGLGMRKADAALRSKVNAALDSLKSDGTLSALSRKYFGRDIIAR
ncbi:ABC transporter substrate-binding protein [Paraburkholderia sp. RCC_158]|uniref:ABC transporter substrate-binding protein n=1 Tax=Paraburkholderia sp. RCC_158 TaxID=3239220 RepID=UPI0035254FA4